MIEKHIIAPEKPKAAVVLVHGMAEHKERYYPFMTYLCENGYACIIADTRGHGPSEKPEDLGWFGENGKQKVIDDAIGLVEYARATYPGLKVFLWGHSMGSMTVRCVLKQRPDLLDGLMISGSPSYNPGTPAGIFLTHVMDLFRGERYRSKLITGIMFGECIRRFKDEPLHNAWLSTNYEDVKKYNEDPLCGFPFTLNGYRTVMQLMADTYSPEGWAPAKENLPVDFEVGADDPFINNEADFRKAVQTVKDHGYKVTSQMYPGMRHEIINELRRQEVWEHMKQVLDSWL